MNTGEAYAQCEQITWEQARNFAYGIRLLPPDKRHALAAVYAYARRIDDIGDGDLAPAAKTERLEEARQQVKALVAAVDGARWQKTPSYRAPSTALSPGGTTPRTPPGTVKGEDASEQLDDDDPVLVALTDTGRRFPAPLEAFEELIDGCLADVNQAKYETFDDLLYYCRCVAGSIGRLSLGIYGPTNPERQNKLADDLGVALQLTNILRDVREDFLNNRIYLPKEDLGKFGIEFAPFGAPEPFPSETMQARFANLVEFEANRAREWYGSGLRLLATIDRRSAACTGAMAGIYRRLLERIARNPHAVLDGRMSLPGGEKALVAAQALAGFDRWKYRKGVRQ
jgi:phytoene synthase